jgi:heptaprenylglyceryl phosphate synthase
MLCDFGNLVQFYGGGVRPPTTGTSFDRGGSAVIIDGEFILSSHMISQYVRRKNRP